MKPLEQVFEEWKANHETLRQEILKRVVRWEYSTGPRYEIVPFRLLLSGVSPGRLLKAPKGTGNEHHYGFDADNRLVLQRDVFDGQPSHDVMFFHDGNTAMGGYVRSTGTVCWVSQCQFDGPRLLTEDNLVQDYSKLRRDHREYEWEQGRLIAMKEKGNVTEYMYDGGGELAAVRTTYEDGTSTYSYRRLPEGVTLETLAEKIRQRLLPAVQATAAAANIREPVYCLVLAYDGQGGDALPPCVGFGLETERKAWLMEHGKRAKDYLWNPAEFAHYEKDHTQLQDEELDADCDLFNQAAETRGSQGRAVRLLNQVAAELAKVSWKGKLCTTSDFVVFAVDYEGADLRKNMKQSVSESVLADLKKNKLV